MLQHIARLQERLQVLVQEMDEIRLEMNELAALCEVALSAPAIEDESLPASETTETETAADQADNEAQVDEAEASFEEDDSFADEEQVLEADEVEADDFEAAVDSEDNLNEAVDEAFVSGEEFDEDFEEFEEAVQQELRENFKELEEAVQQELQEDYVAPETLADTLNQDRPDSLAEHYEKQLAQKRLQNTLTAQRYADLSHAMSLNERFRYQRELFANDRNALSQLLVALDAMESWAEAEDYLNSYHWDEELPVVQDFYAMIEQHFNQ